MAQPPYNVAVVGYGLSAKIFHIPFIQHVPDFKLHGVVQRSPTPENDAGKDHSGITLYRSFFEAIADPAVSVVVVCTTPSTHFAMAKAALEAGKHVIVEKPFVPTAAEAEQLIQIAKKTGKSLSPYHNRRYDADYNTVSKLLKRDQQLGDIAEFELHFDRHRPDPPAGTWKTEDAPGHGALYDLGSHLIDQVHHFFGMPKKVTGIMGNQRRGVKRGPPDSFTVLMQYDDMLATAKAGVVSCEEEQLRFLVKGTKGTFRKHHLDPQEDQLKGGMRPGEENFGVDPEECYGEFF
jgi:predicted dehydrogenase